MECKHHIVKCVNNVYYCSICGARLGKAKPEEAPAAPQETAPEAEEQTKKRKPRRKGE